MRTISRIVCVDIATSEKRTGRRRLQDISSQTHPLWRRPSVRALLRSTKQILPCQVKKISQELRSADRPSCFIARALAARIVLLRKKRRTRRNSRDPGNPPRMPPNG